MHTSLDVPTAGRGRPAAAPAPWQLGDTLLAYLGALGVDYVFGIPGGAIEPLYNALARAAGRGAPAPVVSRHESGAAFMADGYHRVSGRLGVCCATTGPGTTNLVTGVATAFENRTPLLVLTAQTALSTFGRGAFQESSADAVDTVRLLQGCTRYSSLVSHPDQLEHKLLAALRAALHGPRGPSHLSIPIDVLACDGTPPRYPITELTRIDAAVDRHGIDALADLLFSARQPILLLGEECLGLEEVVARLAERTGAWLVTTPHGVGAVAPDTPGFHGVIGFAGHTAARRALGDESVDLVVALGTGLSEWATNAWDSAVLDERLVHVSRDRQAFARSPMARLHVAGDMRATLEGVLAARPAHERPGTRPVTGDAAVAARGAEPAGASGLIDPRHLVEDLSRRCAAGTHLFADTGNAIAWTIHHLGCAPRSSRVERLHTALEFAAMGWAIGAAVGAALASPRRPVACVTGDGASLMAGQELSVAVQHALPIVFVVLNDAALGMVRHGQRMTGAEPVGFELPAVDFAALARAQGAEARVIASVDELVALDWEVLQASAGPVLVDARVDPEAAPPMRTRIRALRSAAQPGDDT